MDAQRLIEFPCHCGHRFSLPVDQASSTIQCPQCRRLNDVPSLSDLESVSTQDGTLLMKESKEPTTKPNRVAEVDLHFRPRRVDDHGKEIDLRRSLEELADIGAPPDDGVIPLLDEEKRPPKPKYDPVSGELIRPMKLVKADDMVPVATIPLAKPVQSLAYASGESAAPHRAGRVFVELCMPVNVIVMIFILVLHLLNQVATFALVGGFYFIVPVPIMIGAIIIAHYCNTLEDTGPEAIDELPRPMRGMSFTEDIWFPFVHLTAAFMFCYAPAYFVYQRAPWPEHLVRAVTVFLALAGSIFFPAVFLTLATSGTIINMRPDRVLGVIRAAGKLYAFSVVIWLITAAAYFTALCGSILGVYRLFSSSTVNASASWLGNPALAYPLMMTAIFLAHFFCWHLGLIYRDRFAQFPWVLQRHVSARVQDELKRAAAIRAQRRKPKYVQKPKTEDGE